MHMDIKNYKDVCRLCLQNKRNIQIISNDILNMLLSLTKVKIEKNDGLPENICKTCSYEIKHAYKFIERCEKSDKILHQMLVENQTLLSVSKNKHFVEKIPSTNSIKKEIDICFENSIQEKNDDTEYTSNIKKESNLDVYDDNSITKSFSSDDVTRDKTLPCSETIFSETDSVDNELKTNKFNDVKIETLDKLPVEIDFKTTEKNLNFEENNSDDDIFKKMPKIFTQQELDEMITSKSKDTLNGIRVKKVLKLGPDKCDISTLTCKVCDKVLVNIHSLGRHMELHEDSRKFLFTCSVCNKGFYERGSLKKHLSRHKGVVRYKCDICSKGFYELSALGVHMKRHKVKPSCCEICKKQFLVQLQLDIHMKSHSTEKRYKCDKCSKGFYTAYYLKIHQRTHIDERNFPCFLCDKQFKTDISLKVHHKRCHTNLPKKTEVCNICGKSIIQYNMKAHMIRHSGVKEYMCTLCPRAFFQIYDLRAHYKLKHNNDGDSKTHIHLCSVCGKKCASGSDLNIHSRIHAGERPCYSCETCDKKYKTKCGLKHHIRATHMDERSHICSVCSKGFHTSRVLQNHMRTHTGERPFVCHLCQRAFTQKSALSTHMKVHLIKNE